jgi:hypothetical protein
VPDARRASANGLPSDSGIIAIVFSPMTCPVDPVVVASNGDSAVTDTVSSIRPTSSVRVTSSFSPMRTSSPGRETFLKPESSATTV